MKAGPPVTAVWVCLDALFPTDLPSGRRDGLVLTGWTAGVLHRWLRSTTGEWVGVVTVLIPTSTRGEPGGFGTVTAEGTYKAQDQLVPAGALRPRH